jgi:tryptophan-rich hypothetical protein
MNKINPKKLHHSKWTAVTPVNKEKHFLVTEVKFDEEGNVASCVIEAIMSRRALSIEWKELTDDSCWLFGWN